MNSWLSFINSNPNAILYCFRGGSRSRIAQEWITNEVKREIYRIDGGYKAFRNYLIDSLASENQNYTPIILTGFTGSGKTIILNKLENSIDLEGLANHRGSSFGAHTTSQPTQINFENNLAYSLIKHKEKNFKHIIIEDEGKNVGRNFIPLDLFNYFHSGNVVVVDVSLEERVENTLKEYVIEAQKEYKNKFGEELGLNEWFNYIYSSMERVKKKLGGDRFKIVLEELDLAFKSQLSTGSLDKHKNWIEIFLKDYYDPLYKYSLENKKDKVIFKGNSIEVLEFLRNI